MFTEIYKYYLIYLQIYRGMHLKRPPRPSYRQILMGILGNKCAICEKLQKNAMVIHHIDGEETNNTLENLELLCSKCHRKIHNPRELEVGVYGSSTLEVLKVLVSGVEMTPKDIFRKTKTMPHNVRNILVVLKNIGYISSKEQGYYLITELGKEGYKIMEKMQSSEKTAEAGK